MDKIYCSNCNAEVIQDTKSCPACGASLKPTAAVPKPTYTVSEHPMSANARKKLKNGAFVPGIVLTGIGLVLYFLAYQFAISVIELGISTVILGLILYKTSEIPNINWRWYFMDLHSEGGKTYLIGVVIMGSGLGLGLTLVYLNDANPSGLVAAVVMFLGGFGLVVVGGVKYWGNRISKWRSEQKAQSHEK